MTVGIIGLGLIGGSLAKAYSQEGHRVLALDTDRSTMQFAMVSGAVDAELTKENAAATMTPSTAASLPAAAV